MWNSLYSLAFSLIGDVPIGLEIVYIIATLILFLFVLLPFVLIFKLLYNLFS